MYNTAYNTSLRILAVTAWVIAAASPATAQGAAPPAKPEMTQSCPGLVATRPPFVEPATLRLAALERDQVRISYVGHATFLIESPQLVRIATDYNDYVRPPMLPDIVTMNHAHSSHFSLSPEPLGGRRHHDLHLAAGLDQQPHELTALVGRDPPAHPHQDHARSVRRRRRETQGGEMVDRYLRDVQGARHRLAPVGSDLRSRRSRPGENRVSQGRRERQYRVILARPRTPRDEGSQP